MIRTPRDRRTAARPPSAASRPPTGTPSPSSTLVSVDRYVIEGRLLVGYGAEPDGTPVRFLADVQGETGGRHWVEPWRLLEPERLDPRTLLRGL